eukprot:PhM_4_TR18083/c3_g6_i1/m.106413
MPPKKARDATVSVIEQSPLKEDEAEKGPLANEDPPPPPPPPPPSVPIRSDNVILQEEERDDGEDNDDNALHRDMTTIDIIPIEFKDPKTNGSKEYGTIRLSDTATTATTTAKSVSGSMSLDDTLMKTTTVSKKSGRRKLAFHGKMRYFSRAPNWFWPFIFALIGDAVCFAVPGCAVHEKKKGLSRRANDCEFDEEEEGPGSQVHILTRSGWMKFELVNMQQTSAFATFSRRTVHVFVMSAVQYYLFKFLVMVLCTLLIFVVASTSTALTRNWIEDENVLQVSPLEGIFFEYSLPFITMFFLFTIMGCSVLRIRRLRKMVSVGALGARGYAGEHSRRARLVLIAVALMLVALCVVLWVESLETRTAFSDVLEGLVSGVVGTVNEVVLVLNTVQFILTEGTEVLGLDKPPEDVIDILHTVNDTTKTLTNYVSYGSNVANGAATTIVGLGYLSIQLVVTCALVSLTAAARRHFRLLRVMIRVSTVIMCILLLDLAVSNFLFGVAREVDNKRAQLAFLGIDDGPAGNSSGANIGNASISDDFISNLDLKNDPFIGMAIRQCLGAEDENATHHYIVLRDFMDRIIEKKLVPLLNKVGLEDIVALRPGQLLNNTGTLSSIFTIYVNYLNSQVVALQNLVKDKKRFDAVTKEVPELKKWITEEHLPLLQAGSAALPSVLSILRCEHLQGTLRFVVNGHMHRVRRGLYVTFALKLTVAILLLILALMNAIAYHLIGNPRKRWYEATTNRWFLFRATYLAHRRVIQKKLEKGVEHREPKDHRAFRPKWSFVETIMTIELMCMATSFLVLSQGIFVLLTKPGALLGPAMAMSVFGGLAALIPGIFDFSVMRRRAVLGFSITCYVSAFFVTTIAFAQSVQYIDKCIDKTYSPGDTMHSDTTSSSSRLLQYEARGKCNLGRVFDHIQAASVLAYFIVVIIFAIVSTLLVVLYVRRRPKDLQYVVTLALHLGNPKNAIRFPSIRKDRKSVPLEDNSGEAVDSPMLMEADHSIVEGAVGREDSLELRDSVHSIEPVSVEVKTIPGNNNNNKRFYISSGRGKVVISDAQRPGWCVRHVGCSFHRAAVLLFLLVLLLACAILVPAWIENLNSSEASFAAPPRPDACNGLKAACRLRLHELTMTTSHNTMSSMQDNFVMPNNFFGVKRALEQGVRGLMLDVWPYERDVYLCHGACELGGYPLRRDLNVIHDFLTKHPREVVVLFIEQYVHTHDMMVVFNQSKLMPMLWSPPVVTVARNGTNETEALTPLNASFSWPTLQELVDTNRRVVLFNDLPAGRSLNPKPVPPYVMYMFDYAVETMYGAASVDDVRLCRLNRGRHADTYMGAQAIHDRLILIENIFLTAPVAMPELADRVNHLPTLNSIDTVCRVGAFAGRSGMAVAVDFWSIGDTLLYERRRNLGEAIMEQK